MKLRRTPAPERLPADYCPTCGGRHAPISPGPFDDLLVAARRRQLLRPVR